VVLEEKRPDLRALKSATPMESDEGDAFLLSKVQITKAVQENATEEVQGNVEDKEVRERFNMAKAKPVRTLIELGKELLKDGTPLKHGTPCSELFGVLLYLSVLTRPDIAFVVEGLSRYMAAPTEEHRCTAKKVLRYLFEPYSEISDSGYIEGRK
jgi:hypothetical protein